MEYLLINGDGISIDKWRMEYLLKLQLKMELPNFPFENFQLLDYYFLSNFQYASKFSYIFKNFCMKF